MDESINQWAWILRCILSVVLPKYCAVLYNFVQFGYYSGNITSPRLRKILIIYKVNFENILVEDKITDDSILWLQYFKNKIKSKLLICSFLSIIWLYWIDFGPILRSWGMLVAINFNYLYRCIIYFKVVMAVTASSSGFIDGPWLKFVALIHLLQKFEILNLELVGFEPRL